MRSKRMTYRNRLYLLFVLAMLIPLSVLCMVFYNISVKSVRENARHVYANMLEQTVARIDSEFEQIRRMSEAYAGSKWVSQIAHMQGKEIDYDRLNVYMLYQYGDLIGRMEASNRYSNRSAIVFVQKEACMLNNGCGIPTPCSAPRCASAAWSRRRRSRLSAGTRRRPTCTRIRRATTTYMSSAGFP